MVLPPRDFADCAFFLWHFQVSTPSSYHAFCHVRALIPQSSSNNAQLRTCLTILKDTPVPAFENHHLFHHTYIHSNLANQQPSTIAFSQENSRTISLIKKKRKKHQISSHPFPPADHSLVKVQDTALVIPDVQISGGPLTRMLDACSQRIKLSTSTSQPSSFFLFLRPTLVVLYSLPMLTTLLLLLAATSASASVREENGGGAGVNITTLSKSSNATGGTGEVAAAGNLEPFGGIGVGCGINWDSLKETYGGGLQAGSKDFGLGGGAEIKADGLHYGAGIGLNGGNASVNFQMNATTEGSFGFSFGSTREFACSSRFVNGTYSIDCRSVESQASYRRLK
ncbi:hypothetical protein AC578_2752 [Pseudocercospora eumusae]|uniref:Uncharacterized protein n=1 Tax=Pseudocercospora eumusae TaxID=321146 RepID=A0A139HH32_9PEZI|nr:hypothetical protein AC578_2752 [Pseudocercospora eumusae]KXT01727.1 hypothetical protein AC578_2752 [Pseudocercospora eumusae]